MNREFWVAVMGLSGSALFVVALLAGVQSVFGLPWWSVGMGVGLGAVAGAMALTELRE